jgi:hypothetical protein
VQTSYEHAQEATALSEDVVRDIGEARELLLRPDAAAARLGLAA